MVQAIAQNHAVTPEQVDVARAQRDLRFDVAVTLLFVPFLSTPWPRSEPIGGSFDASRLKDGLPDLSPLPPRRRSAVSLLGVPVPSTVGRGVGDDSGWKWPYRHRHPVRGGREMGS